MKSTDSESDEIKHTMKHTSTGGDWVSLGEDASSPLTYHMLTPTLVDGLL